MTQPIEAMDADVDETDLAAVEAAALAKAAALEAAARVDTYEVWVGHYSPKTYKATAELVVADPPTGVASGPLLNAEVS